MLTHSEPEEEAEGDEAKGEAPRLRAREEPKVFLCIVAAQILEREANEAVEHDVEGEALPACMTARAEEEEEREDDDVELPLPDLCRPERLCAVCVVGEGRCRIEDAKVSTGRRAEGVAVEEVCTAPQRLTENDGGGDDIEEMDGVKAVLSAVEDADEHAEKDTALDGHTALPDVQQLGQMVLIVVPVKEEDIPEPRTEKPCDAAVDSDVGDVLLVAAPIRLCEVVGDPCGKEDREGDHDAVGTDGKISDVEEILMHEMPLPMRAYRAAVSRGR